MSNIPERHQEFCKAVARLCAEYDLRDFRAQYNPGHGDEWGAQIEFSWADGRHHADRYRVSITSTLRVRAEVDDDALRADSTSTVCSADEQSLS
jgi:hypothetical protein